MVDAAAILDAASEDDARFHLQRCCGAASWVAGMLARRPYGSSAALSAAADEVLERMSPADYVEAFAHHPRIGEDARRMAERFTSTAAWSTDEQSAVGAASGDVLDARRAWGLTR